MATQEMISLESQSSSTLPASRPQTLARVVADSSAVATASTSPQVAANTGSKRSGRLVDGADVEHGVCLCCTLLQPTD